MKTTSQIELQKDEDRQGKAEVRQISKRSNGNETRRDNGQEVQGNDKGLD